MTAVTVPATAVFSAKARSRAGPVAGLRNAEARELVVAFFVAAGDGDWKRVAGFNAFGIVGNVERGRTPSIL